MNRETFHFKLTHFPIVAFFYLCFLNGNIITFRWCCDGVSTGGTSASGEMSENKKIKKSVHIFNQNISLLIYIVHGDQHCVGTCCTCSYIFTETYLFKDEDEELESVDVLAFLATTLHFAPPSGGRTSRTGRGAITMAWFGGSSCTSSSLLSVRFGEDVSTGTAVACTLMISIYNVN